MFEHMFTPRNIAVVGASNKRDKMGNLFIRNLLSGFPGRIFPVHPTVHEIDGLKAYPDLSAVPGKIDLLVPLIPASEVISLVRDCAKGQVNVLLAIPSGFGEVPITGKPLQEELRSLARERGIRVVGPNSVGLFNCPYGLNASMVPERPPGGSGFSCVTQSGGFGMAIYMYTLDNEMEMAKFCDLGNSSDVKPHEVLGYLAEDDETQIIGAFLEAYVERDVFLDCVEMVVQEKPMILTKLGRTRAGTRASYAHIGQPAGDSSSPEGKLRIIPASTGLEMLDIAKGLSWQSLPAGRKVGIVTGSGGVGAELADLCIDHSLEVPSFSQELQDRLRPLLPAYASVQNPVDLTPIWHEYPKLYPPILETLNSSNEVDILLVTIIDVATTQEPLMHAVTETMEKLRQESSYVKPIYINWAAPHSMREHRQVLQRGHIPCYKSTLSAVRTAAAICDYARFPYEREI
jgi:acyl-CoA synthetase (NDP forming)